MEDIVALKIIDPKSNEYYFLTWGRIFDQVDSKELIKAVMKNAFALGISAEKISRICLLPSLKGASTQKYFFESFFQMCQQKIPYGKDYNKWRLLKKREILKGKQIYFIGKKLTRT